MIELKVEFPPGVGLEQLASVQERFRSDYPNRKDHVGWRRVEPGNEATPYNAAGRRADGYFFETSTRSRVVQLRLDAFAMHWMRPYDTWEALEEEARVRWNDVKTTLSPARVEKIGVRYINRIDVPFPIHIQEWLLTGPEVSPALGKDVSDFFMQLQFPYPKETVCVVSQAAERISDSRGGLIFDIDVGRAASFPVDTDEIWRGLRDLRAIKNEVFFKSITPKTKRLCQ